MPECWYCGALPKQKSLRCVSIMGDACCEDCFRSTDDGPCFDDLQGADILTRLEDRFRVMKMFKMRLEEPSLGLAVRQHFIGQIEHMDLIAYGLLLAYEKFPERKTNLLEGYGNDPIDL